MQIIGILIEHVDTGVDVSENGEKHGIESCEYFILDILYP